MPSTTQQLIDQLAATTDERRAKGELLFEGAGEVIADLRKDLGLSLEEVATQLGISQNTLMKYEKDQIPLSDYAVARFAEVYKVNPVELMQKCLWKVLPTMKDSPYGQLLNELM